MNKYRKSTRVLGFALLLGIVAFVYIAVDRRIARQAEEKRQDAYQKVVEQYMRDLKRDASRADVEQYLGAQKAKAEFDSQPDPLPSNYILVRLGEGEAPYYCSRVIVFLKVEFDAADRYQQTSLKREAQDCL